MRVLFFAVLVILGGNAFAQTSLDAYLGWLTPGQKATLLSKNELTVFSDKADDLTLWKGSPFADSVKSLFQGRQTTMAAEALFVIPVPDLGNSSAQTQKLFDAMTAVSTMKGLQVYSNSLKRMETFIFNAYRVGALVKSDRQPDPDYVEGQNSVTFPMYQREEQTGQSFSQYTWSRQPGWYQVTQTNLTSLNYGFIPLVSPHDLLTSVYVVPFHGKVLVYGITVAKTFDFFGIERSKNDSLYTRMKALVTWFSNNLNAGGA